jgi:hypothetical protein
VAYFIIFSDTPPLKRKCETVLVLQKLLEFIITGRNLLWNELRNEIRPVWELENR